MKKRIAVCLFVTRSNFRSKHILNLCSQLIDKLPQNTIIFISTYDTDNLFIDKLLDIYGNRKIIVNIISKPDLTNSNKTFGLYPEGWESFALKLHLLHNCSLQISNYDTFTSVFYFSTHLLIKTNSFNINLYDDSLITFPDFVKTQGVLDQCAFGPFNLMIHYFTTLFDNFVNGNYTHVKKNNFYYFKWNLLFEHIPFVNKNIISY